MPFTKEGQPRPVGCYRFAGVPGATLPDNGSCVASMFTGDEVACSEWVYPKPELSIMSEVSRSRGHGGAYD